MAVEIERRFLVPDRVRAIATVRIIDRVQIRQGYFGHVDGLKLRIRIMVDSQGRSSAVLTRKSPRRGFCRQEYEQSIGLDEAERALGMLPASQIIHKCRYRIPHCDGLIWSVDCFEGQNTGLTLAEIELALSEQSFALPAWAGREITFDPRYGNSALARSPIGSAGSAATAEIPRREHQSSRIL